jgi:hypothetical protein
VGVAHAASTMQIPQDIDRRCTRVTHQHQAEKLVIFRHLHAPSIKWLGTHRGLRRQAGACFSGRGERILCCRYGANKLLNPHVEAFTLRYCHASSLGRPCACTCFSSTYYRYGLTFCGRA